MKTPTRPQIPCGEPIGNIGFCDSSHLCERCTHAEYWERVGKAKVMRIKNVGKSSVAIDREIKLSSTIEEQRRKIIELERLLKEERLKSCIENPKPVTKPKRSGKPKFDRMWK